MLYDDSKLFLIKKEMGLSYSQELSMNIIPPHNKFNSKCLLKTFFNILHIRKNRSHKYTTFTVIVGQPEENNAVIVVFNVVKSLI